ncbi:MAG: YfhO family protein [Firmicutes bacterium]|nr:YfhO family protein [Bacillota bacterium]
MKQKLTAYSLVLLGTPVAVSFILLIAYAVGGFYPFGDGLVSWCDMDQQVVPLLGIFKQILQGKDSLLYSFHTAGGMNFWGVFFFFVASPWHLVLLLVPDRNLLEFMNILTMFKMMTASFAAAFYFVRHRQKPQMIPFFSILYAFCGYALMFYQNTIWLDCMALFPFMLLSLEELIAKKRILPYLICMSLQMVFSYYITYMTVVFVFLYFGIMYCNLPKKQRQAVFARFIAASVLAALLTAVVWLPSYLQYLSSGRGTSILENLAEAELFTHLKTTLPILYASAPAVALTIYGLVHKPLEPGLHRTYLILLGLTLIPVFLEPINLMWHTGSYMSFPVRYGYIPLFLLLVCASFYLTKEPAPAEKTNRPLGALLIGAGFLLITLYGVFSKKMISLRFEELSYYTHHLWGNEKSLQGLSLLFILELLIFSLLFFLYRKGWLKSIIFTFLSFLLLFYSCWNQIDVYMLSSDQDERVFDFHAAADLQNFLTAQGEEDAFYRVKMDKKYFHANTLGSLGFNSLGHYTSLTSEPYLFAMKNLGYSSYWMEVGGYGGTHLSDAYMDIAYHIGWTDGKESLYANDTYQVRKTGACLSLGILSSASNDGTNHLEDMTRLEIQELLWAHLFPGKPSPFTAYEPDAFDNAYLYTDDEGQTQLRRDFSYTSGHLIYHLDITRPQTLYFDCFDKLSNDLSEHIYDTFRIRVNDEVISSRYPNSLQNGLLELGTYSNTHLDIDIELLQPVTCRSFGLFSLDELTLQEAVKDAASIGLKKAGPASLTGSVALDEPKTVYLSVPYDSGFTLKIDGKKAPLAESFEGFMAFELSEGEHEIRLSFIPNGFIPGLLVSLMTLFVILAGFLIKPLKGWLGAITDVPLIANGAGILCGLISLMTFLLIYVFPMLIYMLEKLEVPFLVQ